jgi:hypothetical protein
VLQNVCRTCPLELLRQDIVEMFRMSEPLAWEDVRSASCEVPGSGANRQDEHACLRRAVLPLYSEHCTPDCGRGSTSNAETS